MSGIAGIIGMEQNEWITDSMLASMKHRGTAIAAPHTWSDGTLLQVSQEEQGVEPFTLNWCGDQYTIVLDGCIFNREEILTRLVRSGYAPTGKTDCEYFLLAYLCWGQAFLDSVNGVFALAILQERDGSILMARDRLGVRPLFYAQRGKGLAFASEMKTILAHPSVDPELDVQGAAEILLLGPGRTPGSGVFKDIRELEPGHIAIFRGGNLQLRPYWKLRDRIHTDSFDKTVENVRYLVIDSIRGQLPQKDRIGAMLSGGLDSSIISALCARELEVRGDILNTFSLDYENQAQHFVPSLFQPNMDTDYIRIMVQTMDCNHHWTVLNPMQLIDGISDVTIARDLPGMADIDTSMLAFCRSIRPHSNIVFSGECADEIFGGYPWYREPAMRDYDGFPWAQTTGERKGFVQDWITQSLNAEDFIRERYIKTLRQADILPENDVGERRIKELTYLNLYWFMQTLLERGDRIGCAAGVELRVPFCDFRIVEYLYAVPWCNKYYKGREKGLLRKAMEGVLPDSVLYRKKSPFPKTHDPAYTEMVSKLLLELIQNRNAAIHQLVRKEALEKLLFQDYPWPWYGQLMRRPQTIVYMLQINYWLENYSVRIV